MYTYKKARYILSEKKNTDLKCQSQYSGSTASLYI